MRMVSAFIGKNSDFRAWLREGATRNLVNELVSAVENDKNDKIVSLAEYRLKRKSRSGRATINPTNPIIA